MKLQDVLDKYSATNLYLSAGTVDRYQATLNVVGPIDLDQLSADHVLAHMRNRLNAGKAGRTVNTERVHLLTLWRFAHRCGWKAEPAPGIESVPKAREVERHPTAWSEREMRRLLDACKTAPVLLKGRERWTGDHWAALVSVLYDTCRRIGCVIESQRSQVDWDAGTLYIPGEAEKGRADSLKSLSPRSIKLLRKLPVTDRLFAWPFGRRHLFTRFRKDVVVPAGLPATRRDLFHRIRRTSYTFTARELGVSVASDHASHKSDLSRFYLDTTKLNRVDPVSVLPPL